MDQINWGVVAGLLMSVALAVVPWMVKVHAKLAVIATQITNLCDKLDRATAEQRDLWELTAAHQSRLDSHDVELLHLRNS